MPPVGQAAHADAQQPDPRRRVDRVEQRIGRPGDVDRRVDRAVEGGRPGDRAEVAEADLEGDRPPRQPVLAQPGRHRVGQPHELPLERGALVLVVGERLLVADRLGLLVGLDRSRSSIAVGEVVEVAPVRRSERADDGLDRQGGQVADGAHAEALEAPQGRRSHAPQRA